MLAQLLTPGFVPFAASLLLMVLIGTVELFGLLVGASVSQALDGMLPDMPGAELHGSSSALAQALDWLHVGRIPALVVLVVFLTSFGVLGLLLQGALNGLVGIPLPSLLAVPAVFAASLPATRAVSGGIARIWPGDETSAVSPDSFVGSLAVITIGEARQGSAAEARLCDAHGQSHYLMVEPDDPQEVLRQGESVLVVRRAGAARFIAIRNPNPLLSD